MTRTSVLNDCFGSKSFATHRIASHRIASHRVASQLCCSLLAPCGFGGLAGLQQLVLSMCCHCSRARKQFQSLLDKITNNPYFGLVPARFSDTKKMFSFFRMVGAYPSRWREHLARRGKKENSSGMAMFECLHLKDNEG